MWRDEDGVCHTAAVPDPATLLGARGVELLSGLAGSELEGVRDVLDSLEQEVYDSVEATDVEPQVESSFVGHIPDFELVDEHCSSGDELIQALRLVDLRWKLDMLMAAGDVVADL